MVVKYASVSDKAYSLSVGGWGSMESGVTFTVPAGKTGWTTSEVLAISPACAAVATTKRHIVSSYAAETYIGDIVFFKNKADAEEYAKWAPIYLDPNGDATLRRIQKREENWETIKLIMMLIGSAVAERMELKPEPKIKPFDGIKEEDYYIFDCTGVSLNAFANDGVVSGSFATYYGVDAIKLGAHSNWSKSNSNATFNNPRLPQTFSYAVFRYASESDYAYELGIGWGDITVAGNYTKVSVPAGNTGWAVSDPVAIDGTSLAGASKLAIASTSTGDVYVADIVLFTNRDDAKRYVKQWNAYYADADKPAYDPIVESDDGYYRMTFVAEETGIHGRTTLGTGYTPDVKADYVQYNSDGSIKYRTDYTHLPVVDSAMAKVKYKWSLNSMYETNAVSYGADFPVFTKYNGVDCAKVTDGYTRGVQDYGGKYGFTFDVNNGHVNYSNANREYAVITYATDDNMQIEFSFAWGAYTSDGGMKTRTGVIGASPASGKWMTTAFELTGPWSNEGGRANRGKLGIYSNDQFYIRELVFFETKEDAEAYAAMAPAYFNGEAYDDGAVIPSHPANLMPNDIYVRIPFVESSVTTAISNAGTFRFGANSYTNNNIFVKDKVSYMAAKGSANGSWVAPSVGKMGVQLAFSKLGEVFTKSDDAYMVLVVRSESASNQTIIGYAWAYGNFEIGSIPANTKGWTAVVTDIGGQDNGSVTLYERFIDATASGHTNTGRESIIDTTATDINSFDIAEIVFLKSKTAADAYAAKVTKHFNDIEATDIFNQIEKNGEGKVYVNKFGFPGTGYTVLDSANLQTSETAVVTYGAYDTPCLKITSTKINNSWNPGSAGGYYSFTAPKYQTLFTASDYKYAVVTYATEETDTLPLKLWPDEINGVSKVATICNDMSISGGDWVTTGVIEINNKWADNGAKKLCFTTGVADHDPIYIHSIAYFTEKADAVAYIKAAPAYYNGEEITDDEYWIDVLYGNQILASYDFNEDGVTTDANLDGKIRLHGNGLTSGNDVAYKTKKGVSYIECKGIPLGWASNNVGKKGISFVFNKLGSKFTATDDAWMVVVLRSNSANDQTIGILPVAYGNCDIDTVPAGTAGWYATTPLNVKEVKAISGVTFYEKLTTRECILYTSAEDVESLDVQRIIFFKTEAAAEAFIDEYYG